MSNQSFMSRSMLLAFAMTVAGSAFARQPPSLQHQQAADAKATRSAPGYRAVEPRPTQHDARAPRHEQARASRAGRTTS